MIYLDVTDTCQSPMNSGVQRVTRGIYRGLMRAGAPVTAVAWEQTLWSFTTLHRGQYAFLEAPFDTSKPAASLVQPRNAGGTTSKWNRIRPCAVGKGAALNLPKLLTSKDVFLAPEIFKDTRNRWWACESSRISARSVAIFHDAIALRHPDVTPSANQSDFPQYMLTLMSFEEIIAPSNASADDLQAFWRSVDLPGKLPPVSVLPWPADEMFFSSQSASISNAFLQPKILCVGTFEPRKNHLLLLAAAEKLWREGLLFELVLVGRPTKSFGATVLKALRRLKRARRSVVWHGHVDDASLLAAYDECAFTVFPSLVEGFGLPIMESLLRGRPCICGANGALRELAGGGCLMVDQTSVEQIAIAMQSLLADSKLLEKLSVEAKARVFPTWDDYTAKLLARLNGPADAD